MFTIVYNIIYYILVFRAQISNFFLSSLKMSKKNNQKWETFEMCPFIEGFTVLYL